MKILAFWEQRQQTGGSHILICFVCWQVKYSDAGSIYVSWENKLKRLVLLFQWTYTSKTLRQSVNNTFRANIRFVYRAHVLSAWIVGRLKPTYAVNDVSSFQSEHCCVQQTSLAHNSSSWDLFDENVWMESWPADSGVMFVRIYSTFQRVILSTVVLRTTIGNYSWAGRRVGSPGTLTEENGRFPPAAGLSPEKDPPMSLVFAVC